MKKIYLKSGIFFVIIFIFFSSCSSLKNFNAGYQADSYVNSYLEQAHTSKDNSEKTSLTKVLYTSLADNENKDEIIKVIRDLEEEVNYYRNQENQIPQVEYVFIGSDEINQKPEELINTNKQNSRVTTNSNSDFFNSISTYVYYEGKIYDVYFTPSNVTDIRLEAGESVVNIILGNPNAWICEQIVAKENEEEYVHIFIRPLNVNMQSDCVIATDKRMYYLRLISTVNIAQMAVRWYYPYSKGSSSNISILNSSSQSIFSQNSNSATDFSKTVADLNFNYKISGTASWKPVRAYSDTQRTYIQFKNQFSTNTETPVVYLKQGNEETLVNFSIKGITYIIPLILSSNESFVLKVENKSVYVSQDI